MNTHRESATIISINNISSTNNLASSLNDIKSQRNSKKQEIPEGQTCPICYDTITTANYSPLSTTCSHIFCMPCFKEYLTTKISSLQVLNIPCPYSDCQTILTEKIIQQALDKEAYQNYQVLTLKKIMNRNPDIKFCPKPGCSKQFKPSTKTQYTKCSCGVKICNICCQTWHEGKTCLEAIDPAFELFAKDQDIRFCMMCKSNVQRVHGCKHITCPVCDYEWCWDCGREFNSKHQVECPKTWSPVPPQIETATGVLIKFKKTWRESSKVKRILIFGALLTLGPIILVLLPFSWPMWLCFDPKKDFNRKKPITSVLTIIFSFIVGALYAPFLIPFLAVIAVIYLMTALSRLVKSLYKRLKGENKVQHDGRQGEEEPRIKRWISGNTKSFAYTAHSKPDLEIAAQEVARNRGSIIINVLPVREANQVIRTRTSLDNGQNLAIENV